MRSGIPGARQLREREKGRKEGRKGRKQRRKEARKEGGKWHKGTRIKGLF